MKSNMVVIHGGAPTAVINSSLYGVISEAKQHKEIASVYGALEGSGGVLREHFINLSQLPETKLERLLHTPASAIGSSRDHLEEKEYQQMAQVFKKHSIRYVLYNGGNGSMDACGKLAKICKEEEIVVVGIPKTVDNDIAFTDHSPGYGSAARYIAATAAEVALDIRSMSNHVCVLECMGRDTGWIAAASALARNKGGSGPHRIYLPEIPFEMDLFLEDAQKLHQQYGGVLLVVSEGLKKKDGTPLFEPMYRSGRSVLFGDVGAQLAQAVMKNLGIKARSEKPGICGRASIGYQSQVDRLEAVLVGRRAVEAAVRGKTGVMVALQRSTGGEYAVNTKFIPIEKAMLVERPVPPEFISKAGNDVTPEFVEWCRPLIGPPLPEFLHFI